MVFPSASAVRRMMHMFKKLISGFQAVLPCLFSMMTHPARDRFKCVTLLFSVATLEHFRTSRDEKLCKVTSSRNECRDVLASFIMEEEYWRTLNQLLLSCRTYVHMSSYKIGNFLVAIMTDG